MGVVRTRQADFQPSQSLGGVKTGVPREKTPDHLKAELGLSQVSPKESSTKCGEMMKRKCSFVTTWPQGPPVKNLKTVIPLILTVEQIRHTIDDKFKTFCQFSSKSNVVGTH